MNNEKNNGFGNGFLFGLIIGAVICLLFTTKRGRAVLSELIENGERAIEDFVEPKSTPQEPDEQDLEEEIAEDSGMLGEEIQKPTNGHERRLFRGIKKK